MDQKEDLSKGSCGKNEDHEPSNNISKLAVLELHLEYLECTQMYLVGLMPTACALHTKKRPMQWVGRTAGLVFRLPKLEVACPSFSSASLWNQGSCGAMPQIFLSMLSFLLFSFHGHHFIEVYLIHGKIHGSQKFRLISFDTYIHLCNNHPNYPNQDQDPRPLNVKT